MRSSETVQLYALHHNTHNPSSTMCYKSFKTDHGSANPQFWPSSCTWRWGQQFSTSKKLIKSSWCLPFCFDSWNSYGGTLFSLQGDGREDGTRLVEKWWHTAEVLSKRSTNLALNAFVEVWLGKILSFEIDHRRCLNMIHVNYSKPCWVSSSTWRIP